MQHEFVPYPYKRPSHKKQLRRAHDFFERFTGRRTIRDFSSDPLPDGIIETLLLTAGTAPSGANKQPWTFVVVTDPDLKSAIRVAAEKEEKTNYDQRFPEDWLDDLEPLGTDWHKPFLEEAPCLIAVFRQDYAFRNGRKVKHYYVAESVGIAVGFLLAAVHNAGLVALTHTPSPMGFLREILGRPENEKPYLLIPIGYPKDGAQVPNIFRKLPDEFIVHK